MYLVRMQQQKRLYCVGATLAQVKGISFSSHSYPPFIWDRGMYWRLFAYLTIFSVPECLAWLAGIYYSIYVLNKKIWPLLWIKS